MSTKTMGKPAAKKEASKKVSPATGKADKKTASKVTIEEEFVEEIEIKTEAEETPAIDPDELEEEQEEAAAASSSQSGNAAALAAATSGSNEMSASFKNFRHHPDMENFYRFIFENDLRHEALAIIDEIMVEKQQRKQVKGAKSQSH